MGNDTRQSERPSGLSFGPPLPVPTGELPTLQGSRDRPEDLFKVYRPISPSQLEKLSRGMHWCTSDYGKAIEVWLRGPCAVLCDPEGYSIALKFIRKSGKPGYVDQRGKILKDETLKRPLDEACRGNHG